MLFASLELECSADRIRWEAKMCTGNMVQRILNQVRIFVSCLHFGVHGSVQCCVMSCQDAGKQQMCVCECRNERVRGRMEQEVVGIYRTDMPHSAACTITSVSVSLNSHTQFSLFLWSHFEPYLLRILALIARRRALNSSWFPGKKM